jgi:hypothetical protein
MIKIDYESWRNNPKFSQWWENWITKARAATAASIEVYESTGRISEGDLDPSIWSELKTMLLEHCLHYKCAYCEISIAQSRQSGHQEHFRPKLKVNYRRPGRKSAINASTTDAIGGRVDHPGYFWLAYNPANLLPSCEKCNTGKGKRNQFPLQDGHPYILLKRLTEAELNTLKTPEDAVPSKKWQGFYYLGPHDLDRIEGRILLNPYFDDPREHLIFGHAGIEAAREDPKTGQPSQKGISAIEVLNLSDSGLRDARALQQRTAAMRYNAAYNEATSRGLKPSECKHFAWRAVKEVLDGLTPCSAAAHDELLEHFGVPI